MQYSVARLATALVIAIIGVASGVLLMQYSELDDAPGGVVLGAVLVVGALALGVWTARRKT